MKNKFHNIVARACSGALFVTIILCSILAGAYICAAMMIAILIWSMLEFYNIIIKERVRASKIIGVSTGVVLFVASFFYAQNFVSERIFLYIVPLIILIFVSQLYSTDKNSFRTIAYTITGIAYIALPITVFTGMMFHSANGEYNPQIMLGFFILLWTNDTFAYLTGIKFGSRRLFERISQKKSWEGFWGGFVSTIAMAVIIANLFQIIPFYHWMAIAAIIVVFGVYGNLVESLLKRNLKIKDSGNFLPGHGGILDRFDAVLIAAPMVFIYLKLFVI